MPNANVAIRDIATSSDVLRAPLRPVFLAATDVAATFDWLRPGRVAVVGRLLDIAASVDAARLNMAPGLAIADVAESGDALSLPAPEIVPAFVEIADFADSLDVGKASQVIASVLIDASPSRDALNVGHAAIPLLRDPLPGEVPGAVNLVENPSLEADARGWSTTAGATLTRVQTDPWSGEWHASVTIAAGAGLPEVRIASAANLAIDRVGAWVGSVAMRGDAVEARLLARYAYRDGSETDREWAVATPPVTWERVASEALPHDEARTLDRIDLVIAVPQTGAVQTIDLDGAQIEDATTGGATAYVDGDQGEGHAWFGPEHASVSYREPVLP